MTKNNEERSALNVMPGIDPPSPVNPALGHHLKSRRSKTLSAEEMVTGIRAGNRIILSQAITLVESSLHRHQEKAQEVIAECLRLPDPRNASRETIRVGITGVPGVGKSTFIEALGKYLTGRGHRLAVLAIDPSSTLTKGSILGDKTRMEELANDPNAFIRPSPSAGSLGGVARKTRETIILCESAGFDVIFVETVGVGQSETAVRSMVDFFLLLMLAGAGDELQGIKRGIIEMADAIVIHKADGDNLNRANAAKTEYEHALHYFPPAETGWQPEVDICSSKSREGIDRVWEIISRHHQHLSEKGLLTELRNRSNLEVFYATIEEELKKRYLSHKENRTLLKKFESEILNGLKNPYLAAQELLRLA
ncbi:MAG TPA: methylmalonyl Co-A mutase-associated GTPase MeaB [Bacteroidales bacterium]|nr:methylmalonyl Co-A mutase-associated GTPase MeaB [Bacteroidales bacterium]